MKYQSECEIIRDDIFIQMMMYSQTDKLLIINDHQKEFFFLFSCLVIMHLHVK